MSRRSVVKTPGEAFEGGGRFVWRERYLAYSQSTLQYGLVLLIVLLPSAALRSVKGVLIAALALTWISRMVVAWEFRLRRTALDAPIVAYIVWISICLSTAADPLYSLGELLKLMVSLFLFYLFVNQIQEENELQRLLYALVVTTFMISSYGIFKFFVIQHGSLADRVVRASSFTPDHHWLTTYLLLTIAVLLPLISVQQDAWSRQFLRLTCVLSVIALFLTYTRGAWVAFLAELLVYSWVRRKWLHVALVLGIFVGGVVTLFVIFSRGGPVSSGHRIDRLSPHTLIARFDTSRLALREVRKRPLMGIGYGDKAMAGVFKDAPELKEASHPHNLFIEVALGIGIPGLIVLLWIFSAMLRGTLGEMTRVSSGLGRALLLGLGMAVVGMMVANLFDHVFAKGMAHLFWVLMALAMSVDGAHGRRKSGTAASGFEWLTA